jgi:serine/threonine-protein kinase
MTIPAAELRERLTRLLEGRYRVTRTLGVGGMGAVFLAEDLTLEREVAIKVLPPSLAEDPSVVIRFEREAKTAARLDHTNIIPIFRVESEGGLHYFVMKYVAGRPLDDVLGNNRQLPVDETVRILAEAGAALEHAHRKGVVHRDIKPANILLDQDDRVLLADFGIAKAVQGSADLTNTGMTVGTPYYMSPEQALGKAVDGRCDQYSLAVVGYRMLTGAPLFDGDTPVAIIYKHIQEPPPRVRDLRPDVPPGIEAAIERALSKDPGARFPSMDSFVRALQNLPERRGESRAYPAPRASSSSAVTTPMPSSPTARVKRSAAAPSGGRSRRWIVPGSLVVVALAGVVTLLLRTGSPPKAEGPSAPAAGSAAQLSAGAPAASPSVIDAVAPAPSPAASVRSEPRPPAAAPVRVAELSVVAEPYGTVYLDNVQIGDTPLIGYRIPFGRHELRVEKEGYRTMREALGVNSPNPIRRKYTLESLGGP